VISEAQREVCEPYGVTPVPAPADLKLGLARGGNGPIYGLRHPPESGTVGWYIWRGEFSNAVDFFSPLHVSHVGDELPEVMPFLALPTAGAFSLHPTMRMFGTTRRCSV
jgi:hypothetical protein